MQLSPNARSDPVQPPTSHDHNSRESAMLTRLKLWRDQHQKARSLYGSIVTQARSPRFYAHWGVPDTAEGRFEMIALHLVVVLHRLGQDGEEGQRLARPLAETLAEGLGHNRAQMTL